VNEKSFIFGGCARRYRRWRGIWPDRPDHFGHAATLVRPAGRGRGDPLGSGDGTAGPAQEADGLDEFANAVGDGAAGGVNQQCGLEDRGSAGCRRQQLHRGEARRRLEAHGYSNMTGLTKDNQSIWRGKATKDRKSVDVALDYQGNIVAH
jgi:hypothetical protein